MDSTSAFNYASHVLVLYAEFQFRRFAYILQSFSYLNIIINIIFSIFLLILIFNIL